MGWKFNSERGLQKYLTIQNQYVCVELLQKYIFLGVRNDGLVEKVNCLNGKIEELIHTEIDIPTDLRYIGNGLLLVASKVDSTANIINIRKR